MRRHHHVDRPRRRPRSPRRGRRAAAFTTCGRSGTSSSSRAASRCSSSAATEAWMRSASACTHAIDEPGMMSWNCCVSTSRHRSSTSAGRPAVAAHSSTSRSSRSQRRLPAFVRSWLVSVPRWVSKYSSPRHTGTGAPSNASRSTCSKNSAGDPTDDPRRTVEVGHPACPLEHLRGSDRRRRRRARTASATSSTRPRRGNGRRSRRTRAGVTSAL